MKIFPYPQTEKKFMSRERCDQMVERYPGMANRQLHKCQRTAVWKVDGVPYCAIHAGQLALNYVVKLGGTS